MKRAVASVAFAIHGERPQRSMGMSIVAGVDDLFFMAKILDAARRTGIAVEGVPVAKVQERTSQAGTHAVIFDLNSAAAVDTIRELKLNPATRDVRVVGFVSHVD